MSATGLMSTVEDSRPSSSQWHGSMWVQTKQPEAPKGREHVIIRDVVFNPKVNANEGWSPHA